MKTERLNRLKQAKLNYEEAGIIYEGLMKGYATKYEQYLRENVLYGKDYICIDVRCNRYSWEPEFCIDIEVLDPDRPKHPSKKIKEMSVNHVHFTLTG